MGWGYHLREAASFVTWQVGRIKLFNTIRPPALVGKMYQSFCFEGEVAFKANPNFEEKKQFADMRFVISCAT